MIPVQVAICAFGILGRNITEAFRFIKGLNAVIQKEQTTQEFLSEFGNGYVKTTLIALATCAPAIVTYFPEDLLKKLGLTRDQLYKKAEEGGTTDENVSQIDSSGTQSNPGKIIVPGAILYYLLS